MTGARTFLVLAAVAIGGALLNGAIAYACARALEEGWLR